MHKHAKSMEKPTKNRGSFHINSVNLCQDSISDSILINSGIPKSRLADDHISPPINPDRNNFSQGILGCGLSINLTCSELEYENRGEKNIVNLLSELMQIRASKNQAQRDSHYHGILI